MCQCVYFEPRSRRAHGFCVISHHQREDGVGGLGPGPPRLTFVRLLAHLLAVILGVALLRRLGRVLLLRRPGILGVAVAVLLPFPPDPCQALLPAAPPSRQLVPDPGAAGSRRRRLPSPVSLTLAPLPLHVRLLLLLPLRLQPQLCLLPCQDLLHLLLRLVDLKHGGEMGEASPAEPWRRRLTGHGRHGVLRHSPKPW